MSHLGSNVGSGLSRSVLWVSHFVPYPPRGGALQRSYHLVRCVAARQRVRLLTLNQRSILRTSVEVQASVAALQECGIAVQVFPIPSERNRLRWVAMAATTALQRSPYDVNWLRSSALRQAVRQCLASEQPDVVHVDTIGLLPAVPRSAWHRVVLNHHNIESQMLFRRAEREPRRWRRVYFRREGAKLEALERAACPAVGANVVVSELDGQRLASIAPGAHIAVVENGVDCDFFRPAPAEESDGRHLVFAATMSWHPNHDAMLYFLKEIWPALVTRDAGFRLTIVGKDPRAELVALASADPRIAVTGTVEDIRPFLRCAGIYVCPIREGGGTRLKVLDALAMGKALVATSVAVEGLALEAGRDYLRADTANEFVAGILTLRDAPHRRLELARRGRQTVESRYSWSTIAQRLEQVHAHVALWDRTS